MSEDRKQSESTAPSRSWVVVFAFAGFVSLLAARDVWWETSLQKTESFASFAALLWIVTAVLSSVFLVVRGEISSLVTRLKDLRVAAIAIGYGILSGTLYTVGFYLVSKMGAGLFNMIEYSIYPIALMLLAVTWRRNKFERHSVLDISIYLVGLTLLLSGLGMGGAAFAGLAAVLPIITATCDALTDYLLDPKKGNLTKSQVLFLRSAPAAVVVSAYAAIYTKTGFVVIDAFESIAAAIVCGFVPLWLLCTALAKADMKYLVRWICLIPALTFIGTLHLHWDSITGVQLAGAVVITVGWFLGFSGVTKTVWNSLKRRQQSSYAH